MRYTALQEYVESEKILLTFIPILSVLTDFDKVCFTSILCIVSTYSIQVLCVTFIHYN